MIKTMGWLIVMNIVSQGIALLTMTWNLKHLNFNKIIVTIKIFLKYETHLTSMFNPLYEKNISCYYYYCYDYSFWVLSMFLMVFECCMYLLT